MRYYRILGSVGIGSASILVYQVIRSDDVPRDELEAAGFREVDPELSDEGVMAKYGVTTIRAVEYRGVVN